MSIVFLKYEASHQNAVREFNSRIAHVLEKELAFPEYARFDWLPENANPRIYQEGFVAMDGAAVRGGYILKHQEFSVNGEIRRAASYRLPISEGVADRTWASVGLMTLRDAIKRQPLLFSLGMGAIDRPLPKMQKAMGWSQVPVPFYFKVLRGAEFLRNISALRGTRLKRRLSDLLAATGLASLGSAALRAARPVRVPDRIRVEEFRGFGPWADELWLRCLGSYPLIAVRDADIGNTLYPAGSDRFLCFKVTDSDRLLGWAVCLDTRMRAHKQFGDMRVSTVVDGLAEPRDAGLLLAAVTKTLEARGMDMIVSNQLHQAWGDGLRRAGFFEGPTNFIFSASKQLSEGLAPFESRAKQGHINRGDGDGPIHL